MTSRTGLPYHSGVDLTLVDLRGSVTLDLKFHDHHHETSYQVNTEHRRSTIVRSTPEWYDNPIMEVMLLDHDEPMNYEEAMMSLDSEKWLEAMKSKIGSMYENKL